MQKRAAIRVWVMACLAVEAAALAGFWAWITLRPSAAELFVTGGATPDLLRVFAGGDVFIYLFSGVAGLVGVARRFAWAGACLWLHAGASLYAGACTMWGWGAGWFTVWAFAAMLPAVAGSVMAAVLLARQEGRC
ncbi:MAG: hypothetical protein K2Q20_00040 [Phycisphaerales bacterium]|nr:hypothetical protein [Phycisphaerales bacterium]